MSTLSQGVVGMVDKIAVSKASETPDYQRRDVACVKMSTSSPRLGREKAFSSSFLLSLRQYLYSTPLFLGDKGDKGGPRA
jgi:hypothetical protein